MLGAGATGRALVEKLQNEPTAGFFPIAFLDNSPSLWNMDIAGIPVAGPLALASDFEHRAVAAIVTLADLPKSDTTQLLHELNFARVIVVPDLPGVAL
jgi:FlaA1/EpsC-like NDP-sugar epimerase